jgi:hypothetical protein
MVLFAWRWAFLDLLIDLRGALHDEAFLESTSQLSVFTDNVVCLHTSHELRGMCEMSIS